MKLSLPTLGCIFLLVALIVQSGVSETIEEYICSHNKFKGCRIDYRTRSCHQEETSGCSNPFPYDSMHDCQQDFIGKGNICDLYKPCDNGGICSPITTDGHKRTFKCECSSTGFYGHRCDIECPEDLSARDPRTFPCITI